MDNEDVEFDPLGWQGGPSCRLQQAVKSAARDTAVNSWAMPPSLPLPLPSPHTLVQISDNPNQRHTQVTFLSQPTKLTGVRHVCPLTLCLTLSPSRSHPFRSLTLGLALLQSLSHCSQEEIEEYDVEVQELTSGTTVP